MNASKTHFFFVVDTNGDSREFAEELCAYVTGLLLEDSVPSVLEMGQIAHTQLPASVLTYFREHSVEYQSLICSTWPLQSNSTQSVVIFLDGRPSHDVALLLKQRAEKFCKIWIKPLKYVGSRFVTETVISILSDELI